MPARTVIFDSTSKFDGKSSRNLEAAEYTQMAGRAGRRGLDTTGTVIILCKTNIVDSETLKRMILGKPMRLESQFRLTYAMILSLLRVERVSVEDMMQHSFREFGKQLKVPENKEQLKIAEDKLAELTEISEHLAPLSHFYMACSDFLKLNEELMIKFVNQQKIYNELKPGRVLMVSEGRHYNKLGILLACLTSSQKETSYKLLILDDSSTDEVFQNRNEMWHQMISLSHPFKFHVPSAATGGHTVITIKASHIVEITKATIKCEVDKIIQNVEQRMIPRFKDSPPGPSVVKAVSELHELTVAVADDPLKLEFFPLSSQNIELSSDLQKLVELKENIQVHHPYTKLPNFIENFTQVFDRKVLEEKKESLLFQLSNKNLSLYPDYCNKLLVLQELRYIDDLHQGEIKYKSRLMKSRNSNFYSYSGNEGSRCMRNGSKRADHHRAGLTQHSHQPSSR